MMKCYEICFGSRFTKDRAMGQGGFFIQKFCLGSVFSDLYEKRMGTPEGSILSVTLLF